MQQTSTNGEYIQIRERLTALERDSAHAREGMGEIKATLGQMIDAAALVKRAIDAAQLPQLQADVRTLRSSVTRVGGGLALLVVIVGIVAPIIYKLVMK